MPETGHSHLASRKLQLEIRQLERDLAPLNMWLKRIAAVVAAATTFVALFSGIYEFSKANKENRLKRLNDEKEQITKSFELLSSSNPRDIARGSLGLIQYVESPDHRENIFTGLKAQLSALLPPELPKGITTRDGQREVHTAQIQALIPLIERFSSTQQAELYRCILNNGALKYGRLTALEHLPASKDLWEHALRDTDWEVVEAAILTLSKLRPPFAEDLLLELLDQSSSNIYSSIVTDAAALALGNLKSKSAVKKLIPLLLHSNEYSRRAVADALANIGDKKAIEPLQQAIVKETDEETRRTLESALQRLSRDIQK